MRQIFHINADHFQFDLEDIAIAHDTGYLWDDPIGHPSLAVLDGLVAINTARYGQNTTVVIEVHQQSPPFAYEQQWEQIIEASVRVVSDTLFLTTPEGSRQHAPQIAVTPATYRVRDYYGRVSSVQDELASHGEDVYQLTLWPDSFSAPYIVKELAGL